MSGAPPPPPPPPRPSGDRSTMPSALAGSSALWPSARARLGAAAAPQLPSAPRPTAASTAPIFDQRRASEDAEERLNRTRVGNHFVSAVTPSSSPPDEDEHATQTAPQPPQQQKSHPAAGSLNTSRSAESPPVPSSAATKSSVAVPEASRPPPPLVAATPAAAPTVPADTVEAHPRTSPRPPSPPSQAGVGEKDVLGFGVKPNTLQLPSPVYLAEWIDDTHILLGAGGGGRRFGMANILVILEIDTVLAPTTHSGAGSGKKPMTSPQPRGKATANTAKAAADASGKMAKFVAAAELGNDIPWCTSRFLPYDREEAALDDTLAAQVAQHCPSLVGFFAVSSITCFYLIAVCQEGPAAPYTLKQLARIVIPSDPRNPDKKPISLVHNALAVAHDDAGVLIYRLSSLLPPVAKTAEENGASGAGHATNVPALVESAVPLAMWKLPARANDLHANRLNLVCAKKPSRSHRARAGHPSSDMPMPVASSNRTPSRGCAGGADGDAAQISPGRVVLHSRSPGKAGGDAIQVTDADGAGALSACRALLLNYLVIAAAVQDKTVRLGSVRLRRRGRDEPVEVTEHTALSGNDIGLSFPLLGSSLRLVRLFALENLSPSHQELARRALVLRDLGALPGEGATELASMLIVVFSLQENQSYFVKASLEAALAHSEEAREQSIQGTSARAGRGANDSRHGSLRLTVRIKEAPAPLLRDSITSLSPIHSTAARAPMPPNLFGTAIPQDWVVGSIEGWVARVESARPLPDRTPSVPFAVTALRPSRDKGEAKRFPALHTEPVSCVSVSPSGVDVVTTDIVQNVVISTIPPPAPASADTEKRTGKVVSQLPGAVLHRTDIRLFPPEDQDDSVWALFAEFSRKERVMLFVALSIICVLLAMMLS